MNAEDVVALLVPVTFFGMMGIEALARSGQTWPEIPWWRMKGVTFFVVLMTINVALPLLVPPSLQQYHLINGTRLGIAGGVIVGYATLSLTASVLHRAYHRFPVLWRFVHQLHHSPQRLDIPGAVLFTPLEVMANVALSLAITVFVLGLTPLAAAITGYVAAFYGIFQHLNLRTPRWLGYVIQRPESHSVHHQRGFHACNYSDLPIWDLLFGTFRNPGKFEGEVGFERAESMRVGAMLLGRDVNVGTLGSGSRGQATGKPGAA